MEEIHSLLVVQILLEMVVLEEVLIMLLQAEQEIHLR
tara:strand:- start:375 stop:485 length:111 start_codon:yes stop_codon:yes gene_type:complete